MRKGYIGLSIVLVIFLLLSAMALGGCDTAEPPVDDDDNGEPAPDPAPDPTPDPEIKTLNVALIAGATSNDPLSYRDRILNTVLFALTDSLNMRLNEEGAMVLGIAESITPLDERTYEIKIHPGITFHNGDPLTAEDVAYSFEIGGMEGGLGGDETSRRWYAPSGIYVESTEVIDEHTMILQLNVPNQIQMVAQFNQTHIFPKNYLEEVGREKYGEHPVGAGPFKWVEGDYTERAVLERFEDYWGGPDEIPGSVDRVPAVDRLIFHYIREPTTRVAALLAGDMDIIMDVPFDSIKMLQDNPNFEVYSSEGTRLRMLFFNMQKAPFDDLRVRQAIAYAINIDLLVEELLLGYATPMYGRPFYNPYPGEAGPTIDEYSEEFLYYYNLDKAKTLLAEAGWGDGFSMVIDCWDAVEEAQAIALMLSEIGIDASVRLWDRGVLMGVYNERHEGRELTRDAVLATIGVGSRAVTSSSQVFLNRRGSWASWNDDAYKELVAIASAYEGDTPERNAAYMETFKLVSEQLPAFTLYHPDAVDAAHKKVKNFSPAPHGVYIFHRIDIE